MLYPGAEPTVGPGDNVFAAHQPGAFQKPLGHQLWRRDEGDGGGGHPRNQHLSIGQLYVFPHPPFMVVARIGSLDGITLGIYLQDQVDDVPERNILQMGTMIAAPANVEPHPVDGNGA